MTKRQASYCTDQAKDLRDRTAVAKEDLSHVEEQFGRCLDALSHSDPDLGSIENRLASMARKLRDTAEQFDNHRYLTSITSIRTTATRGCAERGSGTSGVFFYHLTSASRID
jgi:hypothetical protein